MQRMLKKKKTRKEKMPRKLKKKYKKLLEFFEIRKQEWLLKNNL